MFHNLLLSKLLKKIQMQDVIPPDPRGISFVPVMWRGVYIFTVPSADLSPDPTFVRNVFF